LIYKDFLNRGKKSPAGGTESEVGAVLYFRVINWVLENLSKPDYQREGGGGGEGPD